jgi:hypothetical protein
MKGKHRGFHDLNITSSICIVTQLSEHHLGMCRGTYIVVPDEVYYYTMGNKYRFTLQNQPYNGQIHFVVNHIDVTIINNKPGRLGTDDDLGLTRPGDSMSCARKGLLDLVFSITILSIFCILSIV